MSYELKNIKLLGYTTDFNQCECCGKENLKGTISILDLNNDVILHFGSTCAVNANKYDDLNAYKLAKREVNSTIRDISFYTSFAESMIRNYGLKSDRNNIINDFIKFMSVKENRIKRFNWESYIN